MQQSAKNTDIINNQLIFFAHLLIGDVISYIHTYMFNLFYYIKEVIEYFQNSPRARTLEMMKLKFSIIYVLTPLR